MAGIYIHIPFCKSRCRYCDFFSTTQLDKREAYIQAVIQEWESHQPKWSQQEIRTIYLGGGTPSLIPIESLRLLLHSILSSIDTSHVQEITLEANPGDITAEKIRAWKDMGINRLSMGVQSFDDTLLQLIGRRHTAEQTVSAFKMARHYGFDNINMDLIAALPGETPEIFFESLNNQTEETLFSCSLLKVDIDTFPTLLFLFLNQTLCQR